MPYFFAELKPLVETLGPESTFVKRMVGTFHKTDKKILHMYKLFYTKDVP